MNIRDIVKFSNYHGLTESEEFRSGIGSLTANEAKKVVNIIMIGMQDILYFSPLKGSIADYRLQLISISERLENIPDQKIERKSMVDGGYNKIFAFLRKDDNEIKRVTRLKINLPEEKLDDMANLARITCNYCLDRIRDDLDKAVLNNFTKKHKVQTHKKLETMDSWAEEYTPKLENDKIRSRRGTASLPASSSDEEKSNQRG